MINTVYELITDVMAKQYLAAERLAKLIKLRMPEY